MALRAHLGALALVVAVALVAPGAAQAAPLTEKSARGLAVKLARKVATNRDAVSWSVSDAVKVRSNRVVFLYEERTPNQRHCTAKIAVTQSGARRSAVLSGTLCTAVPDEVLAIERATRAAIRALRPKADDVRRSIDAYERDAEDCESLEPPRTVRADVRRLIEAGLELAAYDRVLAELDSHVSALEATGARDATLAAGIVSWRRWLDLLRSTPPIAREACDAVLRWAQESYAPAAAPVDFDELSAMAEATARQTRRMLRASVRLDQLGATDQVVGAFSPYGLLVLAAIR